MRAAGFRGMGPEAGPTRGTAVDSGAKQGSTPAVSKRARTPAPPVLSSPSHGWQRVHRQCGPRCFAGSLAARRHYFRLGCIACPTARASALAGQPAEAWASSNCGNVIMRVEQRDCGALHINAAAVARSQPRSSDATGSATSHLVPGRRIAFPRLRGDVVSLSRSARREAGLAVRRDHRARGSSGATMRSSASMSGTVDDVATSASRARLAGHRRRGGQHQSWAARLTSSGGMPRGRRGPGPVLRLRRPRPRRSSSSHAPRCLMSADRGAVGGDDEACRLWARCPGEEAPSSRAS